jgi:transporter family-2 protein
VPIPWQFWGWALLAVTAGASFVVQASVNTNLRISLNSASWASFISYLGGTVVMALVLLATRQQWPQPAALAGASWLSWTGGFWGVVYVMIIVLLLPHLGAATLLALIVTGQMLASLVFDHFGLFGVPVRTMGLGRLAGAALLILGVILIRR